MNCRHCGEPGVFTGFLFVGLGVFSILLSLGIPIALVYIVVHFAIKNW